MKVKPMLGEYALEQIEYIEASESRALVEHRVPGLAGNYLQDMGSVANQIVIAGSRGTDDDARDSFLTAVREMFATGEPVTFVADINTATDVTDVVIEDLQVREVAGSGSAFQFVVRLRKYTKPPEPPSTGMLDAGILDDAMSVVDALDTLDALASIPDLGDPTGPLTGAMDGVVSATDGLPEVVNQLNALFG